MILLIDMHSNRYSMSTPFTVTLTWPLETAPQVNVSSDAVALMAVSTISARGNCVKTTPYKILVERRWNSLSHVDAVFRCGSQAPTLSYWKECLLKHDGSAVVNLEKASHGSDLCALVQTVCTSTHAWDMVLSICTSVTGSAFLSIKSGPSQTGDWYTTREKAPSRHAAWELASHSVEFARPIQAGTGSSIHTPPRLLLQHLQARHD